MDVQMDVQLNVQLSRPYTTEKSGNKKDLPPEVVFIMHGYDDELDKPVESVTSISISEAKCLILALEDLIEKSYR
jgi:hypothetical protein